MLSAPAERKRGLFTSLPICRRLAFSVRIRKSCSVITFAGKGSCISKRRREVKVNTLGVGVLVAPKWRRADKIGVSGDSDPQGGESEDSLIVLHDCGTDVCVRACVRACVRLLELYSTNSSKICTTRIFSAGIWLARAWLVRNAVLSGVSAALDRGARTPTGLHPVLLISASVYIH